AWRDPQAGRVDDGIAANTASSGGRPLGDVRIVDLSMGWAGPLATRHFADLGADVIKIEACQYPDWWRGVDDRPIVFEQRLYEKSAYFNVMNRNKRSITLDLTTQEGRDLLKQLIGQADIVIDNYSAGVLEKLGLGHDVLAQIKPGLIMLSMPAFGTDGPWRDCRAYGSTLEQASGLPGVVGRAQDPPTLNHIAYGDPIGGLHAAAALLAALYHVRRTGEGQRVVLSQVECMLTMVAPWLIEAGDTGKQPVRLGDGHVAYSPHGSYRCAGDDAWVLIAITDDAAWRGLCRVIGRTDLAHDASLASVDSRRARKAEIDDAIRAWTRSRTPEQAMAALQHEGVAAGASRLPSELLDDPHLKARGFWRWIDREYVGLHPQPSPGYRGEGVAGQSMRPAPTLGQANHDVLQGMLGLGAQDLQRLAALNIIGTAALPPDQRKSRAATGARRA
ncbi:MAG TPA: CoA transferase, partial [Bordetella sp.]|nr:CoA transferase [Bordetella sp.]